MQRRRTRWAAAALLLILPATAHSDGEPEESPIRLDVVSSRPEYVTGGDARIAVTVVPHAGIDPADVAVRAGDRDVTGDLARDPDAPQRLTGTINSLDDGDTVLEATAGDNRTTLTVTNRPTTGPLFTGEQLPLSRCTTGRFGLEPAEPGSGCRAATTVDWHYVASDGARHPLDDPDRVPADAEQVEVGGETLPFVIRTETGVLNRAVYRISELAGAWNERLVYRFRGGCGASYSQGTELAGPSLELLRRGYATATATFNTFATNCNDLVSAETTAMVKEHFIETRGEPAHTIGEGSSGGAMQQLLLAQNQPGLLDGIAPSFPFPDIFSILPGVLDCRLLVRYYRGPGADLDRAQRAAINGHASSEACPQWDHLIGAATLPGRGCPSRDRYHPSRNPDGRRCTLWDTNVAVTGRDPETGVARSAFDNQGVQYGLDALNAGAISIGEFLDLNEQIGGFGPDGGRRTRRSAAERDVVERIYATGRITGPWGGLPRTPTILVDIYTDGFDIHDRVRAFALLDRLTGGRGDDSGDWPATMSLWSIHPDADPRMAAAVTGETGSGEAVARPVLALDDWLTRATEHQKAEGGSWQEALAAAKPPAAVSRCLVPDGREIVGRDANADPDCLEAMPVHEEPRMAAGAPRSGDILKCRRIPVEEAGHLYEVDLEPAHLDRLARIFPGGVCDHRRPGVGQRPPEGPEGTWRSLPSPDRP